MARIIDAFTQFFDGAGNPLVNGKLHFFESGTNNTDKNTYNNAELTTPNANPVILSGDGRCPAVFGSGIYNVILYTSSGTQIEQFDPVGASENGSQFSSWSASSVYGKGDIARGTDGNYYQSVDNANSNNNPVLTPAKWDLITIVKSYIADAAGTSDIITADFNPVIHELANNIRVTVSSTGTNSSTTPSFAPNGLAAANIVKNGNKPLIAGDVPGQMDMVYRIGINKWELLNPTGVPASATENNLTIFDANRNPKESGTPLKRHGTATGAVDVMLVAFDIPITALVDQMDFQVRSLGPNITTTPTINVDGLGAVTIVKNGNQALELRDTGSSGNEMLLSYTTDNGGKVKLLNPASNETFINNSGVITATGTSIVITGIPASVQRVKVVMNAVRTSGVQHYAIRLGSGAIDNAGYTGVCSFVGGTNFSGGTQNATYFTIANQIPTTSDYGGIIVLERADNNTWSLSGQIASTVSTPYVMVSAGNKTLAGDLDRISLGTSTGVDVFNNGSITVTWEF